MPRPAAHAFLIALLIIATALLAIDLLRWLPPCEYEDSSLCYWDAQTRGNGLGTSFADLLIFTIPLP
jgi:hypothetical protein